MIFFPEKYSTDFLRGEGGRGEGARVPSALPLPPSPYPMGGEQSDHVQ